MNKKVVVGFLLLLVLVVGLLLWHPWDPPTATQPPTATPDLEQLIESAVQKALAQSTMPAATPIATATSGLVATGLPEAISSNGWEITEIDVQNDPIVAAWIPKVKAPAPDLWPTFPNVPNPLVPEFRVVNGNQVPDGVEYGEDDSPFCEYKQTCDWVVPAWHYRLISGDYKFTSPKFSYSCQNAEGQPRKGCLIVLFNVMNESYTWRDQSVDNGFTVVGRYWNGDQLQWAVWGLTSHAAANMLNLPSMRDPTTGNVLNAGGNSANAGGNCGIQPDACSTVDVMVIIHAGERILATMHKTVTK